MQPHRAREWDDQGEQEISCECSLPSPPPLLTLALSLALALACVRLSQQPSHRHLHSPSQRSPHQTLAPSHCSSSVMLSSLLLADDGNIVLDPAIRDWVLLPIFLVMFGQGLLRQYVSVLLKDEKKVPLDGLSKAALLRRSQRFRAHAAFLTPAAYKLRKKFFLTTAFAEPAPPAAGEEAKEPEAPPQDPLAMVGMMKQNMMTVLPNMLMMGWVSFFFSGFVLVRLPFPLTERFKSMLQRGIFLNSLNVSYVSSLSWFFINLFGLRGVFALVLGSDNGAVDNPDAMMAAQMSMGTGGMMGGPGAAPDMSKIYQQEKNEVEITPYAQIVNQVESRLLNIPILA